MEIKSVLNDRSDIAKHYWKDLLRKEWIISKESFEGKTGAPLNPQEWVEHYYKAEGAIDSFE